MQSSIYQVLSCFYVNGSTLVEHVPYAYKFSWDFIFANFFWSVCFAVLKATVTPYSPYPHNKGSFDALVYPPYLATNIDRFAQF